MHIDQNVPEGAPRKVVISGDPQVRSPAGNLSNSRFVSRLSDWLSYPLVCAWQAAKLAEEMVKAIMENGPGAMAAVQHTALYGNATDPPYVRTAL